MRISDKEIMQAIWKNQIRLVSKGVLSRYIGGRYSVCQNSDSSKFFASSESRTSRQNVTQAIGKQQLLKRLKSLQKDGLISASHGDIFSSFYIDDERAEKAFQDARNWWLDHGVPEGYENGCANTLPLSDEKLAQMKEECHQYLANIYL